MKIAYAIVSAPEDKELELPAYRRRIPIGIEVEDDQDLCRFRNDLAKAYTTVLGNECVIQFDMEITQSAKGDKPNNIIIGGIEEPT